MIECWKPVPGYKDLYQVSDRGRIRRIAGTFGAPAGRILRPYNNNRGYPLVTLCRNGHRKKRTVHTLVAEAFLGPCPTGLQVNHKNGIKTDNRLGNLEYVTQSENTKHSYDVLGQKVTTLRGEANGQAKLTALLVRQIRRLYAKGGITHRELAKQYGITQGAIWLILHRERWVHVA